MDQKEKTGREEEKNAAAAPVPARKRKRRRLLKTLLIVLGVLLAVRIALPYVILHYANKKLAELDGYYGHIDDINLALIRGAYVIKDVRIDKVDSTKDSTLFFKCPRIDLSVEWKAIFDGKFVGEVEFEQPVVEYTMDKTVGKEAEKDSTDFIQLVKDFMPLRINRFAIVEGAVHFKDPTRQPPVDVVLTSMNVEAAGLTNDPDASVLLPANITMNAKLYDGGITLAVKLDPLNKAPTFDLNTTLTQTNLTHLNPLFQAYANFDVKQGSMSMYAEFAAKEGKFRGYVKPLIKDLDVVQFNKEEGGPLQIAWEALVGSVAEVFQNQDKEQLGTQVPVEGSFTKPDVGVINAIVAVVRNAFVEALRPSLDNTVSIQNVEDPPEEKKEGFFKRILKKDDKKQDKKK